MIREYAQTLGAPIGEADSAVKAVLHATVAAGGAGLLYWGLSKRKTSPFTGGMLALGGGWLLVNNMLALVILPFVREEGEA